MKKYLVIVLSLFFGVSLLCAQETGSTLPQGSSIPGLGAHPFGLNGPGYLEVGGGYSDMYPLPYVPWKDAYVRGMVSGGLNQVTGELSREDRYGDSGWYYGFGWQRTLSENWYANVSAGSSSDGFFLPRLRLDAVVNRKMLKQRQLVLDGGFGYDKSKQVNTDFRLFGGATYYTDFSFVFQGGVNFTRANPGSLLDASEFLAITQGHDKEHFITLRAALGREGYEVVGPEIAIADFPFRQYTGSWRQWVGVNWGVNAVFEHEDTPYYRRNGGTLGIFFEF